jgi:hypothetical protein
MEYVRAVSSLFSPSSRNVPGVAEAQNFEELKSDNVLSSDSFEEIPVNEFSTSVVEMPIVEEIFVNEFSTSLASSGSPLINEMLTDEHGVADLEWVPSTGYSFDDVKEFDDIFNMLTLYANQTGFSWKVLRRNLYSNHCPKFLASKSAEPQDWPKMIDLYCNGNKKTKAASYGKQQKDLCGQQKVAHSTCTCTIRITFNRETCRYYVKACNLEHNGHLLLAPGVEHMVRSEVDLNSEERKFIEDNARGGISIAMCKATMYRIFPERSFDRDMIAREKYYGSGDTVMMKFYEIGQAYMQAGGKFLAVSGDDGRLKYSMFSRPEAAEFLKLYQNFALIDGTHKTNIHDPNP